MNPLLKKTIVLYILDNLDEFQLVNHTVQHFRPYIYDANGEHLIGGEEVYNFVCDACELLSSK